jgi:uncharacterized protein YbaP (TraB family)
LQEGKLMRKKYIISVSLFIFCFLFSFAPAGARVPTKQNHFLWEIRSATGTVYLLGSIHYLKKEVYPLPGVIEDAFRASDILAVEANVDDLTQLDIQKLMDRAFYQGDDSLEKHLSGETLALLKKELDEYGIPVELVYRQKPWFVALTLTSLELLTLGFDPDYGIDRHFLAEAEGKKKIVELESLDYQIDLLSSFSDVDQELFLLYTLRDLHLMNKQGEELLEAWRTGDTKMMRSLVFRDGYGERPISGIYEKLLYERNRSMSSRIEGFLRTKETCFVVVGAAHLIGGKGILETLRNKGYAVKQR